MLSARGLSLARLRALQARAALLRVVQAAPAWPTTSAAGLHPRRAGSTAGAQELNASTASSASTAPEQAAPVPEAQAPPLPLCERPPAHLAPLADLLAWQQRALEHVAAVGDSWQRADEGPSAEDLQTELGWLLDDALTALAQRPGGEWQPTSWRQLERDLRLAGGAGADEQPVSSSQSVVQLREPLEALEAVWERRLQRREPLQYLTSTAFWRDFVLSVGPGVLIPRPETELMVDFVEEAVAAAPQLATGAWADLGTGSGALACGVARALQQAERVRVVVGVCGHQVYAVDLSPVPLAYAAFNARRLGVGGRLTPLRGSWYEPLEAAGVRQLAGVVSNPPYIPSTEMPGLQAEVGRHEPHLALHGGEGLGIDCLLPICTGAARLLQPGGFLALETAGGEQAHYIADLLRHLRAGVCGGGPLAGGSPLGAPAGGSAAWEAGGSSGGGEVLAFSDVRVRKDLRGVDRFVTATRSAGAC